MKWSWFYIATSFLFSHSFISSQFRWDKNNSEISHFRTVKPKLWNTWIECFFRWTRWNEYKSLLYSHHLISSLPIRNPNFLQNTNFNTFRCGRREERDRFFFLLLFLRERVYESVWSVNYFTIECFVTNEKIMKNILAKQIDNNKNREWKN